MRGRPLFRAILIALILLVMGYPVWRVTRAGETPAPVPVAVVQTAATYALHVTFAHPPASFTLSYLGRPLLTGGKGADFTGSWQAALPKEGADLLLKVTWPPGTPRTAAEVRVEDGQETLADRTLWGQGTLTEIVTVVEKP